MSIEPPATAAAVAEPLPSALRLTSSPAFLNRPDCWPYRIGVMSSSGAAASRNATGPAAHARDGSSGSAKPPATAARTSRLEGIDQLRGGERLGESLVAHGAVDRRLHGLGVEALAVRRAAHARDHAGVGLRMPGEDLRG